MATFLKFVLALTVGVSVGCGPSVKYRPPVPTGAAALSASPVPIDPADLERRVVAEVNKVRAGAGLSILRTIPKLREASRAHGRDMAQRRYFAHVSPTGSTPLDRFKRLGVRCRPLLSSGPLTGENLFASDRVASYQSVGGGPMKPHRWHTIPSLVSQMVNGWLDSPDHRDNLLEEEWSAHGIGVVISAEGRILVTHMFC